MAGIRLSDPEQLPSCKGESLPPRLKRNGIPLAHAYAVDGYALYDTRLSAGEFLHVSLNSVVAGSSVPECQSGSSGRMAGIRP